MKKILSLSVLFLLMMGGFFTSKNVSASEGGLPYLVEPILPANQDKGIEHYISVSPKDNSLKQEFEFLVTNKTNKKQTINAKMLNAYTSTNGGIQYTAEETEHNVIIDEKYEMRNYVQVPKKN
ncbi:WxL protein peptidoglycan domain-containing protein [Siminovitchia sediminis]|uniref:WxL protein peptidoglycan domain-containing protein n=1 Tax=Siminovitchia sediminis TaxID=1274353 RepID=A0ABW4KBS2_9BACI